MLLTTTASGIVPPITDVLRAPVVVRVTDFDEADVDRFERHLRDALLTGQPVLPVVIHSRGGEAYGMLAMQAMLDAFPLPVVTIVEGMAFSAGAFLFGSGDLRYMAPDAVLLLHEVSTSLEGKREDVKVDAEETERLSAHLLADLARRCGRPADYFETQLDKRKHADWYLTAPEALRHGLIDGIGVPSLAVHVQPTWTFSSPDGASLTPVRRRVTVRGTPIDTSIPLKQRTARRQESRRRRRA